MKRNKIAGWFLCVMLLVGCAGKKEEIPGGDSNEESYQFTKENAVKFLEGLLQDKSYEHLTLRPEEVDSFIIGSTVKSELDALGFYNVTVNGILNNAEYLDKTEKYITYLNNTEDKAVVADVIELYTNDEDDEDGDYDFAYTNDEDYEEDDDEPVEYFFGAYIYSLDKVQQYVDGIWGKGRIDVKDIKQLRDHPYDYFLAKNDYIFRWYSNYEAMAMGYGGLYEEKDEEPESVTRAYKINSITQEGEKYVFDVNLIRLAYSRDEEQYLTDVSNTKVYEINKPATEEYPRISSYDELLKKLKFRKTIGTIQFVIYPTGEGYRLEGVRSSEKSRNFLLPDSLLDVDYYYTIKSASGLKLRSGPGSDYEVIYTLKNKTSVEVIGVSTADNKWVCVVYPGMHEKLGRNLVGWLHRDYLNRIERDFGDD